MRASRGIELKNEAQLKKMRRAGLVVAEAHAAVREAARPGVTTAELDAVAAEVLTRRGAGSSFLHYGASFGMPPYPAVTCMSVNATIVHGIPDDAPLAEGDLVSMDFGAHLDGFHGDAAITFGIGDLSPARQELSDVTLSALEAGIAAARLGARIGDLSAAIQASIEARGPFGIVREYTGHGIGTQMHQPPDVPNHGRRGRGEKIVPGLCLAIEPMVTAGSAETMTLADEWTVVTRDRSDAAHWEHTITVTKGGVWVLTAADGGEELCSRLGLRFGPLAD